MLKPLLALLAAPILLSATLPDPTISDGYPPVKFMGEADALVGFVNDVPSICGQASPGYVILACASQEKHIIIMPNPCQARFAGEQFAKIMCHEKGHILGWTNKHEDAQ